MPDPAPSIAPAQPTPADLPQALALLAQREQELAALRASHEDWLRALSHDLRAPLRHITSYTPLLRETLHVAGLQGGDAQEAEQFLGVMEQAARRMGSMLDGVLQVAGMLREHRRLQTVDLVQVADEVRAALLAAEPTAAQVQWRLPAAQVLLQADPQLLRAMLTALFDNALKFSRGQSSPQISLQAEALPDGGVRWQVQDNGVGCDGSRAGQVFGLFQRLHRETEFDGVGVGLAVAQTAARQHGAELSLHSAPGQGCTVVVNWPAPSPAQ
ncbi:ATP-binding protein [Pantoea sp. 18069]|uniref:sensor histidine kinase n=1 Tax=Pantoea sp. 18069 TaxID=2681415 RepID=UPI001356E61E|nr:ATP-binding protein [Pantoea sp. 18069]